VSRDAYTRIARQKSTHPGLVRVLTNTSALLRILGLVTMALHHGLVRPDRRIFAETGLAVSMALLFSILVLVLRYRWSTMRVTLIRDQRPEIAILLLWFLGGVLLVFFPDLLIHQVGLSFLDREEVALVDFSEIALVVLSLVGLLKTLRRKAPTMATPAALLALSFVGLITLGTLLLLLPRCLARPEALEASLGERARIALFTATSASCVTGLVVVDTGGAHPYWSRFGQVIIMFLFQIGGLGIMTCGAFFAVLLGSSSSIREQVTLGTILESDRFADVRRVVVTVLVFTLVAEVTGTILLLGMFDDFPWGERIFQSGFHAVSAFCNAGFSLTRDSFCGLGGRWEVWGVLCGLIILGGIGFPVVDNFVRMIVSRWSSTTASRFLDPKGPTPRQRRVRLSVASRVILITTASLLLGGAFAIDFLESTGRPEEDPVRASIGLRAADAWFESVTLRTAGFNTVDQVKLQPGTKLLAIMLMFVGASPGSTGGGVKTVCFALALLGVWSILRGRNRLELGGRSIPDELVRRALAIIFLGFVVTLATTLLLVTFEDRPAAFLDHLFEATSAFATVGVSSVGTPSLSPSSQIVLIFTMFLGRVGPLTLLLALSGRGRKATYEYPEERVVLG